MQNLNKVLITGILTKDPELRYTPTGVGITKLRVAIHRKFKNKANELKEVTEFITVVTWDRLAENCAKYLKKASYIFVEGRLQTRKYLDKNQQERYITEIKADNVEFLNKQKTEE